MNDTLYFVKHGQSLVPLDDDDRAWLNRHGAGELIAFDRPKVKNRDAKDHRRFFVLIRVGFENQPDPDVCVDVPYFDTPDEFRKAWTQACGHVDRWRDIEGNVHEAPRSLAYSETTNDELLSLAATLREKWIRVYGSTWTADVFAEVSRLTGGGNWQ